MASPEYVRAKEKDTGHKVSILRAQFDPDLYLELKRPALDEHGAPLAPEYAAPKNPSSQSGQKANTTKETS